MNTLFEISIFAVLSLFVIYTIHDFLEIFFKKAYALKPIRYVPLYVVCYIVSVTTFFVHLYYLNFIIILICIFTLTFIYKSSMKKRIIACLIIPIFLLGIEIIISVLVAFVYYKSTQVLLGNNLIPLFVLSITRLVQFIIVKIYKITMIETTENKLMQWLKFLIVPILSIVVMHIITIISINTRESITVLLIAVIGIISLVNIVFFNLLDMVIEANRKKTENIILNKQVQYYQNQYRQIENNLSEIRRIKHDLRHRLTDILTQNDDKEIAELINEIENDRYMPYTNHHSLDAILNFEKNKAEKLGVQVDIQATVYKEILVDGQDLCVIMGNALDNAIEACTEIEDSAITIMILQENNSLYISISNPFLGDLLLGSGIVKTKKKDRQNHGIGLKSIRRTVSDIGGNIKITGKDNMFILEILILDC